MDRNNLNRWIPSENILCNYNAQDVTIENGKLIIKLSPDLPKNKITIDIPELEIQFDSFICYQVTRESFREDLYLKEGQESWSFYSAEQSEYIELMRGKSQLLPSEIYHYRFIGADLIVDVITEKKTIYEVRESDNTSLTLSKAEALTLYDIANKFNKSNHLSDADGEKQMFWIIENLLEEKLTDIFSENYSDVIKSARETIVKQCGKSEENLVSPVDTGGDIY